MKGQSANIIWRDGDLPVSSEFDDPYFSIADGLAETRHVFLDGNDLPTRYHDGFQIAELGFGTGLNALAALAAWRESGVQGVLHFTSFEAYPMRAEEMARAHTAFPELAALSDELLSVWVGNGQVVRLDDFVLQVFQGDARQSLPAWDGVADAWFLDGFAPAKNPEMWGEDLLRGVAARTKPGGSFSSFTAAGAVRRALSAAGFEVERVPGFGRKRHMIRGHLSGRADAL